MMLLNKEANQTWKDNYDLYINSIGLWNSFSEIPINQFILGKTDEMLLLINPSISKISFKAKDVNQV